MSLPENHFDTSSLSIQEAARILKVSEKTLRRWEDRGILEPLRTSGGHRRYSYLQLQEFKKHKKAIERGLYTAPVSTSVPYGETVVATPSVAAATTTPVTAVPLVETSSSSESVSIHRQLSLRLPAFHLPTVSFPTLSFGGLQPAILTFCCIALLALSALIVTSTPSVEFAKLKTVALGFQLPRLQAPRFLVFGNKEPESVNTSSLILGSTALEYTRFSLNVDTLINENFRVVKDATVGGILTVESGQLFTSATSASIFPSIAQVITIGSTTSTTTVGGNLTIAGNSLATPGDLRIDPGGGAVLIGDSTPGSIDSAAGDLFVSGDIELDGTLYAPNAQLTTATIGTLLLNGDSFTDLTGTGLLVSNGSLQTSLGTSVASSELEDGSISAVDLKTTGTPGNGSLLSYDSASGGFSWGDGASLNLFTDGGDVTYLTATTDDLTVGSTLDLAKLGIDGDSDEIQFLIQGNSTQTANYFVIEASDGTDVLTVNSTGSLSLAAGQDLSIGGIGLNDIGSSNTTSGAALIGVYDEFNNSNGTTLQDVLDDFDSAMGSGASKWTDSGTLTYLTGTTDDLAIGGSTLASSFSVTVGSNLVRIGTGATADATLALYSSTGDTGSLSYNTSDQFVLSGGNVLVSGLLLAGSTPVTLTTATGYIDADALQLITADGAGSTGSASGLEIDTDRIGLLQGCSDGQVLKWNDATSLWECGTDTGASFAVVNVENNDVAVGTNVDTLDFGSEFSLVASPSNESNISIANNAVDLGTQTVGNYVASVSEGAAIDITGSAGEGWTPTVAFDSTELGTTTFGSGSGIVWTFDVGATDPTLTFGSDALTIVASATGITGNLDVSGTFTSGTGNAFQVDSSGNLNTSGTLTAATNETVNGIDISAGTVSDVVNLTVNAGGDLTIGMIGLNDVGSDNITSGASLVGVFDELGNSNSTTIQDVLDDLDAAITAGSAGDISSVTAGSGLTGGGTSGDVTLDIGAGTGISVAADAIAFDFSAALSGDHTLASNEGKFGQSGLIFEGATANTIETYFAVADATSADKTITFPDLTGTVLLSGHTFTGDVTATLGASNTTALTIAADAVALGTDTTGNYVSNVTGTNGISVSGTAGEGWTAAIELASSTAGNGLTFTTGVLDVGAGNGISVAANSVSVDQAYAFVWTNDHSFQQADPTLYFNDTTSAADDYYISVDADNFVIANNTDVRNDILIEGSGRINIGDNTTGKTIDIAGVNSSAADTVNIATNNTAADVITIGNNNASTTLALTGGDDWSISTAGTIVTSSTISAATDETINGIDISSGTVSDVVNLTVNAGGDLTIGTIGLNDVGSDNITSGASLVGVFDEFANSNSTTVQDVLDDLDAAIAGAGGDITSVVAGSGLTGGGVSGDVTLDIGAGTGISVVADSVALDFSAALSGDHTLAANESKFGQSGLIFEGATANTIETYFAVTDPTSSDKTITFPDLTGTVLLSGHTFTGDVTATLGASNTTALTIAADAVALGTDTTGNYVAGLTEGTAIDISGSAGEAWSPTVTFDSTELGTTTFGSGSGITWTFDVGATDPTLAFASDSLTITAGSTAVAGNLDVSGTFTSGTGNAFQVDASGNLNTSGTLTAATNETVNGIDISAGTVSDVVNLTVNAGGDLTIGTIGLNDVGSDNITSGASLVGVFDEFANSNSTTVQDVLDDLDAAITSGAVGDISSVTAGSGLTGGGTSGDVTLDIGAGTGISVASDAIALDFSAALSGDHTLAANEGKFGQSGLIFEGATANTIETYFAVADATSADKTITFPDLTGTVLLSGHTFTGDVTATLGASNTTALTIAADSVALGTDTTGNYVAGLTEGTAIDISGSAGEAWSPTVTFDSTELGTTTFGSGSGVVWTFDVGATDPTVTFGSDALTIAATSTGITGNLDVSGTLTSGTGNAFQVNGSGNISTSGTLAVNGGSATFGSNGTDGSIVVYNELGATDYSVTLQPSSSQTGSYSLTLPVDDGTSDYVLTTDGNGVLSWQSVTGIGAGSGDITTVGSMATGDVFADSSADDEWLGLGASAGRIEFDDQATDEVNILASNVGIGTQTPSSALHVAGATGITIGTDIGSGSSNIPGKLALISNGDNAYSTVFQTGTQTQDVTYTLPTNDGNSNQVLTTDGSGVLTWVDVTGIGGAGDITSVTAGSGLTGGGTSGDVTLNIGEGTAIDINADDIAFDSTEVGTTTFGSGSDFTWTFNGSGATDATLAAGDNSVTLTAGTITAAGTLALGSNNLTVTGGTLSTAELLLLDGRSGTLVDSNNVSTYATTGVTAGSGLTGGGTVGVLTLDIGAGTGIAVNANDVALDFTAALSGDHTLASNESKFGQSGLIFEGATANSIETYFAVTDPTTSDKTITFPDLSGTVLVSGHTFTGDVSATLDSDNSTALTIAADSVALGTDTTGNYVAGLTEGTAIDISGSAGEGWSPTVTFDSTELGTTTFGSGSGITWTFDVGATDPTLAFASDALTITAGSTGISGNLDVSGTLTSGTGNAFQVDASGNVNTTGTLTAATNETVNGIDISAGTVSDVVNITVNSGGDLTIGTIGLNDVGTTNITSGASLVGAFDEFDNSASTTVQDVLDDLDAAITAGAAGDISSVTAGSGLTGGGTSGDVTLDIGAGTGIAVNANDIAFDFTAALSGDHTLSANNAIFGQSGLIFEGATANTIETYIAVTDPTSSDKTITLPDLSGTVILSGHTFTGDVTATLGASNTTALTIAADSVALGTDTTGNYVAGITEGTAIDVSGSAGEGWSPTVTFDSTELGTTTFGSGSGVTWTFDVGATDPTLAFASDALTITAGSTGITGNLDVSGTLTAGTGNAFQVDASGNLNTSGTLTAATNETINGVDISAGTVSDVVNLTVNAGGDLTIGTIGLNDVGTDNITSGASLVGVFDEFGNSASTTVQDVLDDLDAAITAGAAGDISSVTAGSGLTGGGTSGDVTLNVGEGTAIDINADDIAWDSTEVGTTTFGSGSGITWTFDAGATDPTIAFGSDTMTLTAGTITTAGTLALGSNNLTVTGGTLSTAELLLLDGRSGTLVDSNNVATYATTGVTAGSGLTGGGTVGVLTLDIGAGTGIAVNANDIAFDFTAALSGDHTLSANNAKFGQSGLIFEGATADTIETYFSIADATSADKTITFPDLSGTVLLSGHTFTGDVSATLDSDNSTALTIAADSVALGTDTTGNFVADLTEGTAIDISGTAGEAWSPTVTFDSTELGTTTFGSGSGITWTFDVGATDPTLAFASDALTITAATTSISGDLDVADDNWIGLSSGAGLIEFDDQSTDEINFLNARVGIGTSAPASLLEAYAGTNEYFRVNPNSAASVVTLSSQASNAVIGSNPQSGTTNNVPPGASFGTTASGIPVNLGFLGASAGGAIKLNFSTNGSSTGLHVSHNWGSDLLTILSDGKTGLSTSAPDKQLEINSSTGNNLRLTYNDADGSATNYVDFSTSSSGDLTIAPSGSDLALTGNLDVSGTLTSGTGDAFQIDASGNVNTSGTLTAATNETINGVDISAGTVSDVVNLTVNAGGDLTIGTIGLNDVGSDNITSGASLVGAFDEFDNSASTTVQDVLDDLDAAITTAAAGDISSVVAGSGLTGGGTSGDVTLNVGEGTAIDINADDIAWDSTEVGTTTFGSGSGITWTFDAGATDPTIAFASDALTLTAATTSISGDLDVADDNWIGLSSGAGLIEFDDQTTDEINFLNANLGVGVSDPAAKVDISGVTRIRDGSLLFEMASGTPTLSSYSQTSIYGGNGMAVFTNYGVGRVAGVGTYGAMSGMVFASGKEIGFNSGSIIDDSRYESNTDVRLGRDAAGALGLRNSTNAQTFNIYNTYTNASNYERLSLGFTGNVATLNSNALGTGTARNFNITGGNVGINTTGADAKLDVLSTTEQLRLTYTDGSVYSSFTVDSAGDLTIAPSGSDLALTGNLDVSGTFKSGTGDAFQIDASGNLNTSGTLTAATNETVNGIDISAGTVSDVVNLTVNAGGDLTIGTIGLNDVGSDNITSGASLVGVFDEFDNSNSTTVQDVLDDLDAAIAGGSGDITSVVAGSGLTGGGITGDVTLNVGEGTAIDINADDIAFDSTELGTTTFGSGSGITWTFDAGATDPTIAFASDAMTLTAGSITAAGNLTVSGTTGLTLSGVGGDITFANGEKIDNDTDGTVTITAPTTAVSGDLSLGGGDITTTGGENIDLGEATADTSTFYINSTAELALNATNLTAGTAEGNSLGSATTEWEQLFLGDDNGIAFGLDQDWTLGYDEATDDRLELVTSGTSGMLIQSATATGTGLATTFNALSTGTGLALSSTSTALTSGGLASLDWSPGSATTASGDLFRLNIGTNGTTTGNIFDIEDTGSSLFSVSESVITANLPTNFTAAGDVSMAYDLLFTNQTAAYIKSYGPLILQAGESFENNNLALQTYGTGNAVFDFQGTGDVVINSADPNIIFDTRTATDTDFWLGIQEDAGSDDDDLFQIGDGTTPGTNAFLTINTSGSIGIGTTGPDGKLDVLATSGSQLRLTYADGSTYSDLTTNSSGDLTIAPSGGDTSITGNLAVSGTSGLSLSGVGGDITFANAEKIDNDTDGTVTITAPTTAHSGDISVAGGDITTAGGENIDLGEATADTSTFYINSTAELALNATNLTAGAAEGNSLGSASVEWEQLFLGDDNGIAFGLDQDWTIGYDETTDDRLELVTSGTSGMLIQSATATGTGLATTFNALSSGTGLSLTSTSTALTSGSLASVDWSPGSSTFASGDVFKINIGTNGTTSGNLFNVMDSSSSLFSVSEAAITANLPTNFTAAGDVSMAYDLQFTNQTSSTIKSKAPLYIEAGESFESNDLTLRSYNAGDVIVDLQGTGILQVINQSTSVTGTTTTDLNVAGAYINSTDLDTISLLVRNSNTGAITMQNVGTAGAQGDPGVLTVEGAGSSTTAYNLITAYNSLTRSDAASVFRVRADGTVYGEAAFQTTGADLAEYFEKEGDLPTNEVVGINYETGKVRRFQAGDKLLGVTSNRAGFVGNYPKGKTDDQIAANYALVGFTGQLDVKLDDAEGSIRPGDPLRPSTQSGRATKANKPGYIIGYALESWTPGSGDRDVLVYVNPSFADPTMALDNQGQMVADGLAQLASNPDAEANKTLIRSIAASLSEIVDTTSNVFTTLIAGNIQSSTIQTDSITVGGKSLQNLVLDTIAENGFLVAKSDKIETREASISGILTAEEATISGNLTAKNITEMANRLVSAEASISSLLSTDATMSAEEKDSLLATLNPEIKLIVSDLLSDSDDWSTEASSSADVITADAVFASEYLNVQGSASITNANINNALIVGGSLAMDKNSISLISDTEATLYVQATGTGTLDLLAGTLTLNREGGLVVTTDALFTQDVTIQGALSATTIAPETNILGIQLTASESSALASESGKIAIKSGDTEVASIDASGSATFAKLSLATPETATGSASTASTGKAVLKKGQTDVIIYTTQVSDDSLIYITPTSSTNNQVLYVSGKQANDPTTVGGFTVTIDQALSKDVEFNWWIIN